MILTIYRKLRKNLSVCQNFFIPENVGVSGDRRNNNNNRRGGQSGRGGGGRGGGSHGGHSRGEGGIDGFLAGVNASGICDAYLNTSVEDRESCTDDFLGEVAPGRAQYRLRRVNSFICLAGGVEADDACEILDVACNSDEASTLESCPRSSKLTVVIHHTHICLLISIKPYAKFSFYNRITHPDERF